MFLYDSKDSIEGRPTKDGIVRNRRFHSLGFKKINEREKSVSLGDFLVRKCKIPIVCKEQIIESGNERWVKQGKGHISCIYYVRLTRRLGLSSSIQ